MSISTSTVTRDWNIARAWLRRELSRNACHGDATLCHDVTSLLAAYDELGDFLETPVLESEREELPPGSRIGSYEIREPLAEGGMGTVYRAVRTSDFEKQVAVKVVKRGMDTKSILRRFRHERQLGVS